MRLALLVILAIVSTSSALARDTFIATGDGVLLQGSKNDNEGANPRLTLAGSLFGKTRVVVAFDREATVRFIRSRGLTKATLVLVIAETGVLLSRKGQAVDAYRLSSPFTEGNGKRIGVGRSDRKSGHGPGVTWNCASDGDVANLLQDCVNDWRGASSGAPVAASVIHTKNSTSEMSWDVTADVRAGAIGWVLRKSQGWKWGSISYYSREAARDLGNIPLAPKLVIEP